MLRAEFTDEQDTLTLDISSAYDVPSLTGLRRTFTYSRAGAGSLTVSDEATFSEPQAFGVALVTMGQWDRPELTELRLADGPSAVRVRMEATGGRIALHPEDLKEDLPGGGTPTRIGIDLDQPVTEARIRLTITPGAAAAPGEN